MLHFNNLDFYPIPALPAGFRAPDWLKAELGLFAGRLYFEWDEYPSLEQLFGISADDSEGEQEDHSTAETDGEAESQETTQQPAPKLFTSAPLNFMQEWLAVRRRGQDFSHTPMGFIASGKPVVAEHPFFRQEEAAEERTLRNTVAAARIVADNNRKVVEEVAYEGGIDLPVSDGDSSSEEGSEIEYHDDELYSEGEDDEESDSPEMTSSGDDGRGRARPRRGGNGNRGRGGGRRR